MGMRTLRSGKFNQKGKMIMFSKIKKVVSALLFVLAANAAQAAPATFNLEWSGTSYGNTASAIGFITFDDAVLVSGAAFNLNSSWAAVLDLGITISGAGAGNGSFGLSDFGSMYFNSPSGLDFTRELIGQTLSNGSTFGTSDMSNPEIGGDFNLFGSSSSAPNGTWYFQLTPSGTSESMLLTSMAPVPEPTTYAMLIAGLGLLAVRRRKYS